MRTGPNQTLTLTPPSRPKGCRCQLFGPKKLDAKLRRRKYKYVLGRPVRIFFPFVACISNLAHVSNLLSSLFRAVDCPESRPCWTQFETRLLPLHTHNNLSAATIAVTRTLIELAAGHLPSIFDMAGSTTACCAKGASKDYQTQPARDTSKIVSRQRPVASASRGAVS